MRCNDFDTFIDEMLSGVLHPDASQHMRECERCTSYFRSRSTVQNGLRKLAAATLPGPSSATDRAVMNSYRLLQQRRSEAGISGSAVGAGAANRGRLFNFPSRKMAPARFSRWWWSGAAAVAMVAVVAGSAVHLWNGALTVQAPVAVGGPAAAGGQESQAARDLAARAAFNANQNSKSNQSADQDARQSAALNAPQNVNRSVRQSAHERQSEISLLQIATAGFRPEPLTPEPVQRAAVPRGAAAQRAGRNAAQNTVQNAGQDAGYEAANYESRPATQLPANVIHLASSGASGSTAQPASSTWPGYSNLMYCDPVVCSGPMQVVHIKVPVGQAKPSPGQRVGNGFVNAEVVVGPDGVARAIRVAN